MRLDWIRVTAPETSEPELERWCMEKFGETRSGYRTKRWKRGWKFDNGATLLSGQANGRCQLELPGALLGIVTADEGVEWLRELMRIDRVVVKRIDVAIDFLRVAWLSLFAQVVKAYDQRNMFVMRSLTKGRGGEVEAVEVKAKDTYASEELRAKLRLAQIGGKGSKGSGTCIRVYDKGLETGQFLIGTWERYEVEFYSDCAQQVADRLIGLKDAEGAPVNHWQQAAYSAALNAVDFRARDSSNRKDRSPRLDWWEKVMALVTHPGRIVMRRRASRFLRFVRWSAGCVAPLHVAMSKAAGVTLDRFITDHIKPVHRPPSDRSAFWEFMYMQAHPGDWEQLDQTGEAEIARPPWLDFAREVIRRWKDSAQPAPA